MISNHVFTFSLLVVFMSGGKTADAYTVNTVQQHGNICCCQWLGFTWGNVISLKQQSNVWMNSESLLFDHQTALTGSPTGINAACLRLSPLICSTPSTCCPMIHSCWIIDALFTYLSRASSVHPSSVSSCCSYVLHTGSSAFCMVCFLVLSICLLSVFWWISDFSFSLFLHYNLIYFWCTVEMPL